MFEIFLTVLAIAVQTGSGSGSVAMSSGSASAAVVAAPAEAAPTAPAASAPQTGLQAELQAEPQVPTGKFTTATEVKPILTATRANWIAVRDYNGQDLVYVTHLWAWRCGLLEVRIGLNGAPAEVWPLPDCHLDQPMPGVMLEQDGLPYRAFPPGSVQMIEVQLTYDDLSVERAIFDRGSILMP